MKLFKVLFFAMRDGEKKKFNVPHHGLALLNVYLEATTAFFESVKSIYKKQIYQNEKKKFGTDYHVISLCRLTTRLTVLLLTVIL